MSYQPNPALGEVFVKILDIERRITAGGQKLLGLQNEKRSLVLEARKMELAGREDHEIFKLRYHHAVEDVKTAESAMDDASKQHKRTKEEHDDALELLTKLEEKTEEQLEVEKAIADEAALPIVQMDQATGNDETWRLLPLDTLKLSPAILGKLANPVHKHSDKSLGEITTLGGLADLLNKHQLSYGQLKGMSSATAGKIEEAWMEFWESRKHLKVFAPLASDDESAKDEALDKELGIEPVAIEVEVLLTHGATKKVTAALRAGDYAQIGQLETIINDDDLLGDVVGKKAVKNIRLAYESWRAMQ